MTTASAPASDLAGIRACFPALRGETVYLDNAAGAQVPEVVADRIRSYMLESYVQLGGGYEVSRRCSETVDAAHAWINLFMNGTRTGSAILGASCTQLCAMLAAGTGELLSPGDEIVVADNGHEANIGPWLRLERAGVRVRWWRTDHETFRLRLEDLAALMGPRTRVVAMAHVSNILGTIEDVAGAARIAHDAGARLVVDGVAYASHRAIDVEAWDVDWYVYSTYKVFGPHMAALYGRHDAIDELPRPNHELLPRDMVPYVFEPGGVSHEGCAGLLGLATYFNALLGLDVDTPPSRALVEKAFECMTELERPLQERLLAVLSSADGVEVVGPCDAGADRVSTISVRHRSLAPRELAAAAHARNIGVRAGPMYAHRLLEQLGIPVDEGVLRISPVHYNTLDEIDLVLGVLEGMR